MNSHQLTTDTNNHDQQAYDYLVQRILRLHPENSVYLFAGGDKDSLPVSMPINTALRLACKGIRCLLIDLDLDRSPISKSFELPVSIGRKVRPLSTCLDSIFVWPAAYFSAGTSQLQVLARLTDKARRRYAATIIYAQNLDTNPHRKSVAQLADYGFIFSENASQATRLAAVLKAADCKVIGSLQGLCDLPNHAESHL